jgi:aspartate dehydrogenase
MKVAIIGCGAIGTVIAKAIDEGKIEGTKLVTLFDRSLNKATRLASSLREVPLATDSFDDLLKSDADLIVEAASQEAVVMYAERVLAAGKDLLIMSVGALLDSNVYEGIDAMAKKMGRRVYVPSGAVAGVDGLRSASLVDVSEVTLTVKKNPKALTPSPYVKEKGIDLSKLAEPLLLYEGPAIEAVKLFPVNVNVAATLSLASLGGNKTLVRVVADPTLNRNVHEVHVKGDFGEMELTMKNVTHPDNPKTSYIAALSAIELLRSLIRKGIKIGT